DSLCARGHVLIPDASEGAASLSDAGSAFLRTELGIDLGASAGGRPLCRTCLDWSERRPHLAGRLGAALCRRSFELGWISAARDSRAVLVTAAGHEGFARAFGIEPARIGRNA
ncbi:MAG: transcriptional regulator, partial [Geminicoccaceae bacterium]